MDNGDRWWDFRRDLSHLVVLNIVFAACSVSVYAVNQLVLKKISHNVIVQGYLNDVMAMVLLLSYSNLIISMCKRTDLLITTLGRILPFALGVGLFWEYVTPLYRDSFPDPVDLIAYTVGGLIYYSCISGSRDLLRWFRN